MRAEINTASRLGLAEDDLDALEGELAHEIHELQGVIQRLERKLDIKTDRINYMAITILLSLLGVMAALLLQDKF